MRHRNAAPRLPGQAQTLTRPPSRTPLTRASLSGGTEPPGKPRRPAVCLTGLGTILLLLIPFIPGLRDIPRLIPIHRLIWRSWYRPAPGPSAGQQARPADKSPADKSPAGMA